MSDDPLSWISLELAQWRERRLLRQRVFRCGALRGGRIEVDGREYLNFSSNDYLGLAGDKPLTEAVSRVLADEGFGAGASPLVTGQSRLHARLEADLADFEKTESALLFTSGYAANVGTISALVGREDVVLSDAKNHASIIDGCRLSGAAIRIFAHADPQSLEAELSAAAGFRRRLVATDTVFSMDGDLAPLPEIARLAKEHQAMLMVDEAHATGVFGPGGCGLVEHHGLGSEVHVRVGTLSKALGGLGGFVAGPRQVVDFLAQRARSFVFSTAAPAAQCAAALAALAVVRSEPWRRKALLQRAGALRAELAARGWRTSASPSQIIPLYVGDPQRAVELSDRLKQHGIWVGAIRPPSVPQGESLLRICLSSSHSDEMLSRLVEGLELSREAIGGPRATDESAAAAGSLLFAGRFAGEAGR